ncbi:serine/threonine-protein phosphatase 6 regulatory ankyrin repeat subunit B-like [Schistocerca serialis cubense]|uniref:serine/threonine-protein phosphatase 6 regulatory ankyrin repeat subunit B-like n=1 Tax=Schistocerca serialis cubense TaxID=2023355 RepID=UPI00214EE78E|nr:serine/threonine-protein phosphatase 6 regulatory ankyrin repeat subunit B-like [Schistocerca serialis cubense]XP_049944781.1 serine/threonine-protein phosphatase 6 regulatory ankyrin repeat subunit B-like [Schistocerca serialis cubense]
MFRRNACWFILIFVAVVICSGYSHPVSVTESLTVGLVQEAEEATAVDLGDLLDAGDGAVVTLLAGDTRLVAHRAVLAARSAVFAGMLRRLTLEASSSSQLTLSDTEGPVLRQVLAYLYTLQVPQLPSMAPKLLVAADVYGLSVLKAHCEQQVVAQLSVETAAAAGVIAIRHSANRLKQAAVAFIKAHLLHVMATQGWAEAVVNDTRTVVELVRLIAETPTDTSTRSAGEGRIGPSSQPHTDHSDNGRRPATAARPTSPQATPQPHDAAVSLLRNLSGEEKGKMLVAAAEEGSVSKVRTLLAAGADVEAMDENQQNALHWAAGLGHVEVVRLLLEEGADVNARDRWRNTPLHQAAWNDDATVVRLLAASFADCNARDDTGNTPLHDAARRGQADAATALLEVGADREVRNYDGDTPLDLAERNNHEWLIDILGSS